MNSTLYNPTDTALDIHCLFADTAMPEDMYTTTPIAVVRSTCWQPSEEELHTSFEQAISDRVLAGRAHNCYRSSCIHIFRHCCIGKKTVNIEGRVSRIIECTVHSLYLLDLLFFLFASIAEKKRLFMGHLTYLRSCIFAVQTLAKHVFGNSFGSPSFGVIDEGWPIHRRWRRYIAPYGSPERIETQSFSRHLSIF